MASFLLSLLTLPLLAVHAQYPEVSISDGEIRPAGTFSACSTLTTTIGSRVDIIPVPCQSTDGPLPFVTEEVKVDSTSAALIIGPSGNISFLSRTLLNPQTSSSSGSASSSQSSSTPLSSVNASSTTGPRGTGATSRTSSSSRSTLLGSGITTASSSSSSGGTFTNSSSVLGTTRSSDSSSSILGTGGRSTTAQSTTGSSSSSSLSTGGPRTGTTSNSSLPVGGSSTGTLSSSSSFSSQSTNSSLAGGGSRTGTLSSSSSSSSQATGGSSSSSSQSSGGSTSTSQSSTATPGSGSTSSSAPASTTTPATTSAPNAISSTITATTSLIPTGIIATSSAKALSSSIVIFAPILQSWIDNPKPPEATAAINILKGVLPVFEELAAEIGPPPTPEPCHVSTNLITDIFNAVSCAVDNVNKAVEDIEKGVEDDVKTDLENLNNLKKPLDNPTEEDDENKSKTQTQRSDSQSQSQSSQSSESESSSSRSSSSSSSRSSSSSNSSSITSTSSSGSCALPPEITLPPDSSASVQPDQPTSVSVTGLSLPASTGAAPSSNSLASSTSPPSSRATSATTSGPSTLSTITTTNPPGSGSSNSPSSTSAAKLSCSAGSNLGLATFDPATWCGCNTNSGTLYPTLGTGSGNAACAFSTIPSSTVKPTVVSASATSNSLSCAASSSVPTSVPQDQVQKDITSWCSGELNLFKSGIGCDNKNHDGFFLTRDCTPDIPSYSLQYYFPGTTLYFNVSLATGTDSYVANSSTCLSALGTVLNGCPPTSGNPLVKYGGSIPTNDGAGNTAIWQINLTPVQAIS